MKATANTNAATLPSAKEIAEYTVKELCSGGYEPCREKHVNVHTVRLHCRPNRFSVTVAYTCATAGKPSRPGLYPIKSIKILGVSDIKVNPNGLGITDINEILLEQVLEQLPASDELLPVTA